MPSGLDGDPNPISTPERSRVLAEVARTVLSRRRAGTPLLVAVDGVDGSGKSTFADELADHLARHDGDLTVVRASIDSFHHPRRRRWARGRSSPVGFYLDSHDLDTLRRLLLDPLADGREAVYRIEAFDEPTDRAVDGAEIHVGGHEVLLFDGLFLCRPELIGYWDVVIFLDAGERVSLDRLGAVLAEAPPGGEPLVDHVLQWVRRLDRYVSGMRYYLDAENPAAKADLVIDNNDLANPMITTHRPPHR
ncbi:MAG: uridine kinase [Actinomycetota bacterium]